MANFTNIEWTNIVLCYGAADENSRQARVLYQQRFPNVRTPDERTFVSAVQHLRDHGHFQPMAVDRGRTRSQRTLNAEPRILDSVEENPGVSIRRLSAQIGVSEFVVWRTLNEQGLHPYHVQKVQALQPGDELRRQQFCGWLIQKCAEEPNFLRSILFTDEAGFTRDGVFNVHNTHIWSDENPHAIRESHHQQKFSVNVWAGIIDNILVGPYILPNRLNGPEYLRFLREVLPDLLDDVPLQTLQRMWYLLDGAPAHYAREVVTHLNVAYPDRWIGRNGPVLWPPRSPDLTPCDYFLWGCMKQIVYSEAINTQEQLTHRIEMAAQQIRDMPNVFSKVRDSMLRRAQACIDNGGLHFEHFI